MEYVFNDMNIVQLENYRQRLISIKKEIEQSLTDESDQAVELDQSRMGRLSRMDALQSQQIAIESQRRLQRRLIAVEGALKRVDSDEFGLCFICDEPISDARLNFDPTVTRCIDCVDKTPD
jgi:RNA polymerase-binding transcription factor